MANKKAPSKNCKRNILRLEGAIYKLQVKHLELRKVHKQAKHLQRRNLQTPSVPRHGMQSSSDSDKTLAYNASGREKARRARLLDFLYPCFLRLHLFRPFSNFVSSKAAIGKKVRRSARKFVLRSGYRQGDPATLMFWSGYRKGGPANLMFRSDYRHGGPANLMFRSGYRQRGPANLMFRSDYRKGSPANLVFLRKLGTQILLPPALLSKQQDSPQLPQWIVNPFRTTQAHRTRSVLFT